VVATSIPLSICCSVLALHAMSQTINIMTLGGLALAVGILGDDATVEIENIHRNLALGKSMIDAILDGAQQIATPAFVATLSICIVFVPILFLGGVAHYLFAPLALAVVFAMMASYLLSRTAVPTMVNFLLRSEHETEGNAKSTRRNWFARLHEWFNHGFEKLRDFYVARLEWALNHARLVVGLSLGIVLLSLGALVPFLGENFFPLVDAGQFRLHVRAPVGTRIEETQHVFSQVEGVIRSVIPKDQIDMVLANIGLPMNLNLALSDTATISSADGEILVSLNQQKHGPTWGYVKRIRQELIAKYPNYTFFVDEYPGQAFAGTVARDAGAFDPRSRTLLLEIDVPNADGRLYAGMYAHAKFVLPNPTPALLVPDNAILIDAKGPRVVTVDRSDKIQIKPVTLGRDYGTESEILGGLDAQDRVVQNPADDLHEGMPVSIQSTTPGKTGS
jgi:multidrug efflux pump subunit AcrB